MSGEVSCVIMSSKCSFSKHLLHTTVYTLEPDGLLLKHSASLLFTCLKHLSVKTGGYGWTEEKHHLIKSRWWFLRGRWWDGIMVLTCWLTRQCEGPWWMRMRTMSTSPRQAARCSGKQPLLSATFVDASNCSSFSTTSLRETDAYIQINISKDGGMERANRRRDEH